MYDIREIRALSIDTMILVQSGVELYVCWFAHGRIVQGGRTDHHAKRRQTTNNRQKIEKSKKKSHILFSIHKRNKRRTPVFWGQCNNTTQNTPHNNYSPPAHALFSLKSPQNLTHNRSIHLCLIGKSSELERTEQRPERVQGSCRYPNHKRGSGKALSG